VSVSAEVQGVSGTSSLDDISEELYIIAKAPDTLPIFHDIAEKGGSLACETTP
jgi:hypothetical protein